MDNKTHLVARLRGTAEIGAELAARPECGPGDIIVQVRLCGICGSDLAMYRGGAAMVGAILGHEFVGHISEVGAQTSGFALGQRVVVNPMIEMIGLGKAAGAFANYARVADARIGINVFPVPDSVSDEMAALVEPYAVALRAASLSGIEAGKKAVIFGAGAIGLCILAALRDRGVEDVVVIEPSQRRREVATAMGAMSTIDPLSQEVHSTVLAALGSEDLGFGDYGPLGTAQAVFDCAGVPGILPASLRLLGARGRLVIVAEPKDPSLPDLRLLQWRELSVVGVLAYAEEFAASIERVSSGAVDLLPLISHRFPLRDISNAFAMQMDAEAAVKVLVEAGLVAKPTIPCSLASR